MIDAQVPAWLQQRALFDTQQVTEDTGQGAGMLGRLTGALIGAGKQSSDTGTSFFKALGDNWKKAGGVKEQAAWNALDMQNINLTQARDEQSWQNEDMPKFAQWQQQVQKDPTAPQPAWKSQKYFQQAQVVEQQASMNQYRKNLGDAAKQRAQNVVIKMNDVNDFTSALGAVDPQTRAFITDPENGLVNYDQQGNVVSYKAGALPYLNEGLQGAGLPLFTNNWGKTYQDKLKQDAAAKLQTQKASETAFRIDQIYSNKTNLATIQSTLKGSKDRQDFIAKLATAIGNNPAKWNLGKQTPYDLAASIADKEMSGEGAAPKDGKSYPKPSDKDVSYLAQHPELKAKFESRFGPGSADQYLP